MVCLLNQISIFRRLQQSFVRHIPALIVLISANLLLSQTPAIKAEERQLSQPNTETYQFNQLSILQGLLDNDIYDIIQDDAGFIWMASSQGLIRYDGISYVYFHHNVNNPSSLSANEINVVYEDQLGRLWVGTQRGLNLQYQHENRFQRFYHDPSNSSSLADDRIIDITQDSTGRMWHSLQTR